MFKRTCVAVRGENWWWCPRRWRVKNIQNIMESFIQFSPFPLHCKFKFSFKILAFEILSKFLLAVCVWRKLLIFEHKLFDVTPGILIPFTLCCIVIEDYIILFSVCHASCKLCLLKKLWLENGWLSTDRHVGQHFGQCIGRIKFFTYTRKCPY